MGGLFELVGVVEGGASGEDTADAFHALQGAFVPLRDGVAVVFLLLLSLFQRDLLYVGLVVWSGWMGGGWTGVTSWTKLDMCKLD